jgi:carbon-monoxide dehydrogenase medium subunit
MKSAAFDYVKPESLDQVISLLQKYGDDCRILAGGQTLMATLNMRLSEPQWIVDITGIDALGGISLRGNCLRIGALVTHAEIEFSPLVEKHAPLLKVAAPHIAHRAIRNSGTWGGSIAYADPAAEWPACFLALGGDAIALGPQGERRIPADHFFTGLYSTALNPDEILLACEIPVCGDDSWFGFDELARRHGDYAIVGMAACARRNEQALTMPRIVLMGVDAMPKRAVQTERFLEGKKIDIHTTTEAVKILRAEIEPLPDLTHSPATKRHLTGVLLKRLLASV